MALVIKNLPANTGDARVSGSIPGSGRSPGVGNGNPPQYSCLENFKDRVYQAVVHGVTKNWTQLSTHTNTHSQTLHKKYVWYKNVNYTSVRKKSGYQKPSLWLRLLDYNSNCSSSLLLPDSCPDLICIHFISSPTIIFKNLFYYSYCNLFNFWVRRVAYRILVPRPRTDPRTPALEVSEW